MSEGSTNFINIEYLIDHETVALNDYMLKSDLWGLIKWIEKTRFVNPLLGQEIEANSNKLTYCKILLNPLNMHETSHQ